MLILVILSSSLLDRVLHLITSWGAHKGEKPAMALQLSLSDPRRDG